MDNLFTCSKSAKLTFLFRWLMIFGLLIFFLLSIPPLKEDEIKFWILLIASSAVIVPFLAGLHTRMRYKVVVDKQAFQIIEKKLFHNRVIELKNANIRLVRVVEPLRKSYIRIQSPDGREVDFGHYLDWSTQILLVRMITEVEDPGIGQWIHCEIDRNCSRT